MKTEHILYITYVLIFISIVFVLIQEKLLYYANQKIKAKDELIGLKDESLKTYGELVYIYMNLNNQWLQCICTEEERLSLKRLDEVQKTFWVEKGTVDLEEYKVLLGVWEEIIDRYSKPIETQN